MNWTLLQNSLLVSGFTALFSIVMGLFAALCFAGINARWRKFLFALAIISVALPPFLVTNCWLHYLGLTGAWRPWLPLNIFSLGGTIWILTLMHWPITTFLVIAAWRRLEQSQIDVDPLLTGSSLLRWLLLPLAGSSLAQAAVITFVLALNNFAVPAILQVKVFPAELWVNFNTTFDYKFVIALSWPMIIIPALLLIALRGLSIGSFEKRREISAGLFRRQLGRSWFGVSATFCCAAIFFSAILPLSQLMLRQATWSHLFPAFTAGKPALLHSILFATLAATAIAGVSILSARFPLRIVWLPFLVPGVLLGISFIWLLNRPPLIAFYQSIGVVVLAFAIRYLAPGWNVIAHSFRTMDRSLSDAAILEGANHRQLFWQVHLPQIFPQLCVAWYVSYLFCLWDVETLVLIVPPGSETLSLRIFNLLHYGHNAQVDALCILLLGVAVLPLIVSALFKPGRFPVSILRTLPALILPTLFMVGCSDSSARSGANHVPIRSQIFSHVEIIGLRGTGSGQFNKPRSLALDKNDNLFVVDMTGRVQKFSSSGAFLASWQMPQTDLGKPKGMCRDADKNIVVLEPHYSRVNHFSPEGRLLSQWGTHGTNLGQLAFPRGIAVNSRGEMFVSEYGLTERVQRFSNKGEKFLDSFGKPGDGAGEFNRAEGLGIDSRDQVFVADSCNHRIQVFASDGKFITSFGKAGTGVGELSYPYDVRVDGAGLRFICEFGNSRIQIFDAKNQPLEMLGEAGPEPGQFANPWSIDLDSRGNLYVADASNHRVQKFMRREPLALAPGGLVSVSKSKDNLAIGAHPAETDVTR